MELRQLRYFVAVAEELPPRLALRPVAEPIPLWTWSLLHRHDDDRSSVSDVVNSLLAVALGRDWLIPPAGRWWIPSDDPHRCVLDPDTDLR